MKSRKPLLHALNGGTSSSPPLWIMRQAGRYLPEYRATRRRAGTFLDLCFNPELAAEVSLQPVRRFGLDATILFSDILLIAGALGSDLDYVDGYGPALSEIKGPPDVDRLCCPEVIPDRLDAVYETLRILRQTQPVNASLIGFAGSPWTVATYMIAGSHKRGRRPALAFLEQEPDAFSLLIDKLVEATILHLQQQIMAGAEAVKLFDSWAGSLEGDHFDQFVASPNRRIITALKTTHPEIPVILFPRGAGDRYSGLARQRIADCLAIDQSVPTDWAARQLQPWLCVQGNLEPSLMVEGGDRLVEETVRIAASLSGGPHVFNLGHGITPDARVENVEILVETIRSL